MKKMFILPIAVAVILITAATCPAEEAVTKGMQLLKTIEVPANENLWPDGAPIDDLAKDVPPSETETETLSYWLFLPTNTEEAVDGKFPLILFLHGAGERGMSPEAVKTHGPPKILESDQVAKWPFITVSPQCAVGKCWSSVQLNLLLDEIEKNYDVDVKREYVTGLSMGGFGTWKMLLARPDRFAAAAPVCGGVAPEKASEFVDIPIHIFHGEADTLVLPSWSTNIFKAITEAGGKKVLITTYPGVGHDSWNKAYEGNDLWTWFLKQKKD